jgi:hypothetical protein
MNKGIIKLLGYTTIVGVVKAADIYFGRENEKMVYESYKEACDLIETVEAKGNALMSECAILRAPEEYEKELGYLRDDRAALYSLYISYSTGGLIMTSPGKVLKAKQILRDVNLRCEKLDEKLEATRKQMGF